MSIEKIRQTVVLMPSFGYPVDDIEYTVDEELPDEPIDGDDEDGGLNSTVV